MIKRPKVKATSKSAPPKAATKLPRYLLRLYVSGMTPSAIRAIQNLRAICHAHLAGRYRLKIIDIYQQPVLAKGEQIIAAPTLIKHLPLPLRRVIGDMSNKERVLLGLDLRMNPGDGVSPSLRPEV